MQSDIVQHRNGSVIQHGHHNNRVYVMHLDTAAVPEIIRFADELANGNGYTKIFVKVPESVAGLFAMAEYVEEARVPFFFPGEETALFMAKYRDPDRKKVLDTTVIADTLANVSGYTGSRFSHRIPVGFSLAHAHPEDAEEIAALYKSVFKTYPFPIMEPEYIRKSMQGQVRYFVIRKSRRIAAVASCDIDAKNRNVEVTDFATDPEFRGIGLATLLLSVMETEMKKEGIVLAYTIARALSQPVNATFAGAGYRFGGLLPNNTQICGMLESMNVWYKRLSGETS